jgi:hypothetical protein
MTSLETLCPRHADVAATATLSSEAPPRRCADCAACADVWTRVQAVRELGQRLTWDEPDAERVSRMRGAVLASLRGDTGAPRRREPRAPRAALRHWGLRVAAVASLAAAIALGVVRHEPAGWRGPASSPASLAVVQPRGSAHFRQVSRPPDEEVRLTDGTVHVTVIHLDRGQRFRIVTADATVEVRGTEFDVDVVDDHLRSVDVSRGTVEVRIQDREVARLTAGLRWQAASPKAADAPSPAGPLPLEPPHPSTATQPARRSPPRAEAARVSEPRPPATDQTAPATPPAPGLSPGGVGAARSGAPPAEATARGKPEPLTPPGPNAPRISEAAGATAAPSEPPPSRLDERLERRQERRQDHLERRRELREERLHRRH